MANRLATETSPYLLQHAHNPVDWYPWGSLALERARAEDRPILLSIGYSACHWCHVMERESFQDAHTAELMNRSFVSIKVDREERPDLDAIYMRAIQALAGRGGWPLTAFLTPEGVPFYGGTYFPPEPRQGMPSFRQVLAAVAGAWDGRRGEILAAAEGLRSVLETSALESSATAEGSETPAAALAARAFGDLERRYDSAHGGFGGAPKFPQPTTLEFLLAYGTHAGETAAVDMVVHTLRAMAAGGIRDHLGGGFHRYSVDARWLVPHFEKMLYDNALLARLYVDAWRATGLDDLRRVAESTLDYLVADLGDAAGGFYAARDADSEGEEGTYYLWAEAEIEAAAGEPEGARLFRRVYGVEPGGHLQGRSVLHLPHAIDAVARAEGVAPAVLEERLSGIRDVLSTVRSARAAPFRDEKVLCAWSAMAVRALAEAGPVLDRPAYLDRARRGADFLLRELAAPDGLYHVWTGGRARIGAFLDDWAALGNACLSLHEATLERPWLDEAARVCDEILARFWSADDGLFYDTEEGDLQLIVRPREVMDQATPSGIALTVELLLRAGHNLDRPRWIRTAHSALARAADSMSRFPAGFGRLLTQVVRDQAEPREIVIVGSRDEPSTRALLTAALRPYLPNRTVTGGDPTTDDLTGLPLLKGRTTPDGPPRAYVCSSFACAAPAASPAEVEKQITRPLSAGPEGA